MNVTQTTTQAHKDKTPNKTSSRTKLGTGQTASILEASGANTANDLLAYHVKRRVELFFIDCAIRHNVLQTSSEFHKQHPTKVLISKTTYQGGSGSAEAPACHSNLAFLSDNIGDQVINLIKDGKTVREEILSLYNINQEEEKDIYLHHKKLEILKKIEKVIHKENLKINIKKFLDYLQEQPAQKNTTFDFLANKCSIDEEIKSFLKKTKKIEEKYTHIKKKIDKQKSLISNTRFEKNLNLTVNLPRDNNLLVDAYIERNLRKDFLTKLMSQVIDGKKNPKEATKLYVQEIQENLKKLKATVKTHTKQFKKIFKTLKECTKIEKERQDMRSSHVVEYLQYLENIDQQLEKENFPLFAPIKKIVSNMQQELKNHKTLTEQRDFLKNILEENKGLTSKAEQIENIQNRFDDLLNYIKIQQENTFEPAYSHLIVFESGIQKEPSREQKYMQPKYIQEAFLSKEQKIRNKANKN